MTRQVIDNPIINRPFDAPSRHWRFDEDGLIVPEIDEGRRPSESWIPVPQPKKRRGRAVQQEIVFDHTLERRKRNDQVNQIRQEVDLWRKRGYPDVTSTSRRLLDYWAAEDRDNRILFCQREAAETAVYLTEAAPKQGAHWIRGALDEHNAEHNARLPRVALKMATGSGKTIVMAMLIAWHTLNKAASPNDARFVKRFLVVTPGITIRDRLRVLLPADEDNYYRLRDVVPADLWGSLRSAEIVITNFHTFLLRTTREGQGLSSNTKALLTARIDQDPFTETPDQMVNRVLREFSGSGRRGEIVVLNDEAHHCYLGRDSEAGEVPDGEVKLTGEDKAEARARNKDAGIWFSGLQHIRRKVGIKSIYDLSATPFFLKGSGYPEGYLFPWVVSDFSLMDAIEAGIVKVPRVPVDDNATTEDVVYLNLWNHVGDRLPRRQPRGTYTAGEPLPATLQGALESLYGNYRQSFESWESSDAEVRGETPPVFIVVCNNTTVSKMVYDTIAGYTKETGAGDAHVPGTLPLFSNYENGKLLSRPRTILVDSAQLESGEAMTSDFKKAATDEIEAFRHEYTQRTGRSADDLDDTALLREVMNTVGKVGKLGADVRCVVSVSMLTEGWDANTVTHVLGVRAFGSQLLCEQVVGRGLRRRSYAVNEEGYFEPEYAEVYGVPFSFIRTEPGKIDPKPPRRPVRIQSLESRHDARIRFPKLEGYRVEIPEAPLRVEFGPAHAYTLRLDSVPTLTQVAGVVGGEAIHDLAAKSMIRPQAVAFGIAKRMLERSFIDAQQQPRRWLFPQLVEIARSWLEECVTYEQATFPGLFTMPELEALAAERISQAVFEGEATAERILPVMRRFDPEGSTDVVDFFSTKAVYETDPNLCPVNFVVLDGVGGNTWEQIVAQTLEALPDVAAYVKNDHLEFAIPYVHAGRTHRYLPDFLVRLKRPPGDVERHLVVEVSGTLKSRAMSQEKADTARNLWCTAVNNMGGWGRWGYIEITDPTTARQELTAAMAELYRDGPLRGIAS